MKPKVYTFFTETHKELFERFDRTFDSSGMIESFDLIANEFKQECSGNFMEVGWNNTMRKKVEYVLRSINETFGGWFIHADCDIQFFADMYEDIAPRIENYDLVAQNDNGTICAGFFACRSNERMRKVFEEVLSIMDAAGNDQRALNALKGKFSYQLLPNSYFTVGNVNGGKIWNGETNFMPPKKTFMHHANYVIGPEKKMELMDAVSSKFVENARKTAKQASNTLEELLNGVAKIHLGSEYGGWTIDIARIKDGDTILDLGLGEDITFSEALVKWKNVNIIGVDPTEKSHRHIESITDPPLKLIKKAVAKDGVRVIRMYKNMNPAHVSESFMGAHAAVGDDSYEVECISVKELRGQYPNISLIKMDIEGGEYDVLDECLGVPQLCVEFHHFCIDGVTSSDTNACIRKLLDYGYEILDKNAQATEFTFKLKS
jgi:FkbM family methyltransferase